MTLRFNDRAAKSYLRDPKLGRELLADGWKVANLASSMAPVGNYPGGGAGARSIRAELVKGIQGIEVRVSWDKQHFYMGFQELGTEHHAPQPFLRPAANRFRR